MSDPGYLPVSPGPWPPVEYAGFDADAVRELVAAAREAITYSGKPDRLRLALAPFAALEADTDV